MLCKCGNPLPPQVRRPFLWCSRTCRERLKEQYAKYKKRMIAATMKWARNHPERSKRYIARYRERNRDAINVRNRERTRLNPEPHRIASRKHYRKFHERSFEKCRRWRKKNAK